MNQQNQFEKSHKNKQRMKMTNIKDDLEKHICLKNFNK